MPKRISKLARSLRQLGEIQVTEWDFMTLLNKDIGELEVARSLRRLGNIRVMEWDFKTVVPAVTRLANQEVDLMDLVRRTANYKVMEWDFRDCPPTHPLSAGASPAEMRAVMERLKTFLGYVVANLIDEPKHAQIKVQQLGSNVLRFKLVLVKRDVAMLIGREGHTASAIRGIVKAAAEMNGVRALLQILSHEEAMTPGKRENPVSPDDPAGP